MIVGSRSLSRGENFSPYLNFSDVQIQNGVTAYGNFTDDTETPTGRCAYFLNSLLAEDWYTDYPLLTITYPTTSQYQGTFHAYLRVKQIVGNYGDFTVRLKYSINGLTTETKCPASLIPNSNGGQALNVIDCGIIALGTNSFGYGDSINTIQFRLELKHNVATASTVEVVDLILMPCDEWIGAYKAPSMGYTTVSLNFANVLDVDAVGNPRLPRAILRLSNEVDAGELNEQFISDYIKMTRGGPFLQVNADQRLWFTTFSESEDNLGNHYMTAYPSAVYDVRVYIANRYLTMRGAI